jgi:hypothetical protein
MPKKEPGFAERLQTAAKAKKAQLEKTRALSAAGGIASTDGQTAQSEAEAARKLRTAERKQSDRLAAQEREAQRAADKVRQAQAAVERLASKEAERLAQIEAAAALKNDQKAARDAKYAARKARQR